MYWSKNKRNEKLATLKPVPQRKGASKAQTAEANKTRFPKWWQMLLGGHK